MLTRIFQPMVSQLNAEKGWQIGIHVDAASGGFIAPFQEEMANKVSESCN